MDNAILFEAATKGIVSKRVDEIDPGQLSPERFAWLDFDGLNPEKLRPLLIGLGVSDAEVDELLRPDYEYWSQHHQECVLSKVQVCRLEGENIAHVSLIIVMTPAAVVTARGGSVAAIDKVYSSYRESFETVGKSPAFIYFLLWDALVDGFLPKIFYVDNQLEELEEEYMGGKAGADVLDRIAKCKHMVRALKRSLLPMQRVMRHLAGSKLELVSDESRSYLSGLFDHMDRVSQSIDSLQDRVHSALAGYNSVLAQQQNNALKVLTIIATLMMPLSLIAAIYGMNFDFMPELRTRYGYFIVLGVMGALGGAMLLAFKRRKWL
ncbi:MAG: magnesium transporter CorA family protein [Candidatus Eisenbacteria sp.]|nr:magnesium transporter CorA family protein [Candidatus Eisenbacteria bacterium]